MIRFGTIGTNWITDNFIESAECVEGFYYNAVYSRSKERAELFAAKYNVKNTFTSLEKMAQSDKIDAVYIASPNAFHYEQSKLFLKNKKHVIVEKPAVMSKKEAIELYDIAEKNGVIFMEGIVSIYTPQAKTLKKALNDIGTVRAARIDYSQLSTRYPKLVHGDIPNIFNPKMKTGCLMDLGVYCFYAAIYLFGMPQRIQPTATFHENGIDLCGATLFTYPDKTVTITYSKVTESRAYSEIQGDMGTLKIRRISLINEILRVSNSGHSEVIYNDEYGTAPMAHEIKALYNFVNDFENHREQYEEMKELCLNVSDMLAYVRGNIGLEF